MSELHHEHHHEEHECCEHEHHHEEHECCEHEHHHEEHYCCEHEHHHEHDCCEHEHHHEHEVIKLHEHEGAIAASFEKDCSKSLEEIKEILSDSMKDLGLWVKEEHGVIGHIKSSISVVSETEMLSLTKDTVYETVTKGGASKVSFAAIVIGVHDHELEEELEKIYQKL